ncbi:phage baseplate assembly protein V [Cryptosporangium sp. NPDC051539]|uniref:phage baseplate assembly protein V n=1 Tax=Cryptosporangium sp. NPDC051539 TaxID=3363962 RepID=UPI0037ABB9F7
MNRFYGKYRGTVVENTDDSKQHRLRISCPAVLGEGRKSWALPCLPYAGDGVGLSLLPPVGAWIWVEFEGGDPNLPIWTGCFWGPDQVLPEADGPAKKILRTDGVTLTIDDTPNSGGVSLAVGSPVVPAPLTVRLSSSGIELVNGNAKVTLTATTVSINDGALEVM